MRGGRSAVGGLARHDLRHRWRTVLAVGLLFGLAAGAGLACIAGARRTESLFSRHLEATHAADLEIDPGALDAESDRALRSIPEVEEASAWTTLTAWPLGPDGEIPPEAFQLLTFTSDERYLDMDQVAMVEGRRLDPEQPDEVMINELAAEILDVEVGDTFPLGLFEQTENGFPASPEPDRTEEVTVVGIMALNEDVVAEELDQIPRMFISPAFQPPTAEALPRYYGFSWYGLRLRNGTDDVNSVIEQWNDLAAEHNQGVDTETEQGWLTFVHRTSELQLKADRAVRPLVVALGAFGALATLAALVLVSQSLARTVRLGSEDVRTARVLGLRPTQSMRVSLAVPGVALGLAVAVALTTALLLSRQFPTGPYQVLEPHPGFDADLTILLPGLVLVALVPLAAAAIAARQEAHAGLLQRVAGRVRRSRLVAAVSRSGAPSPVVASLRLTAEPGEGRTFVPTRSVLTSNTVVVVALITVIVFGGNLSALARDSERYGFVGNGVAVTDGGYGRLEPEAVGEWLNERDDVNGWRMVGADHTNVEGRDTPGLVYGPSHGSGERILPVLTEGRAPAEGEVVLGTKTMAAIDAEIGSTITIGSGEAQRDVQVVGTAVFPVLGPVLSVRTGLDEGLWVAEEDDAVFDVLVSYGPVWNFAILDVASPDVVAALNDEVDASPITPEDSDSDVAGVIKPAEISTATDVGGYQVGLLSVLGVVGLLSTLLTLLAVVRRRRPDLAVYRVLGFRPWQLRSTITLQGLWFALAALVIGTPVGIVLGTQLWRLFTDKLGVVPDPEVVWGPVLVAAGVIVVVGLLSAVPPAVAVGRQRQRPPEPA